MITFTDAATQKVREYMDMNETPTLGVRVVAHRFGRHQFRYELALVTEGEVTEEDRVIEQDAITVYLDPQSAEWLEGASVDFVTDTSGTGFQFNNPQAEVSWDDPLAQRVQKVIDERIAPSLAGHGGWVELLEVDGDAAVIQFGRMSGLRHVAGYPQGGDRDRHPGGGARDQAGARQYRPRVRRQPLLRTLIVT